MSQQPRKRTRYNKVKVLLELSENVHTFSDNALCYNSENPDMWFSEIVEKDTKGAPLASQLQEAMNNSLQALKICTRCPVRRECFVEGMRKENLDYGIWGGTMSGERLIMAGESIASSDRKGKVAFATKMRARYGYL